MTGGLFAILDDIAMLLDDAAVMSKIAAKKQPEFWETIWPLMLKRQLASGLRGSCRFYGRSPRVLF